MQLFAQIKRVFMNAYDIIDRKKKGLPLKTDQINWVIENLVKGDLPDYQMSALLMAIFLQGMSKKETADLTYAMLHSGKVLTFEDQTIIDKHSTGGVGDKTSFILAPIAAAAGVKVPMIAGRGLGHTGGTVDKIEAIKGFKTNVDLKGFANLLQTKGLVLIGQTKDIAPADKIIYSLRDVTATIDSIPLITASIMSKKLAEGANGIVMDIKVGNGAFMTNLKDARKLAKSILETAKRFDKKAVALLTNMSQPNGHLIGNSLEIIESMEVLKNNGPDDLTHLSLELAANMIHISGIEKSFSASMKKAKAVLKSGKAIKKFESLIKNQGGDHKIVNNYDLLPVAKYQTIVEAPANGWVNSFETTQLGFLCTDLGGGRRLKTDKIDFGVGFNIHKKIGDKVKAGEPLVTIYHNKNQKELVSKISNDLTTNVISLSKNKVKKPAVIFEKLTL
jgi:pyrimidine-nucleoside phosphorylase